MSGTGEQNSMQEDFYLPLRQRWFDCILQLCIFKRGISILAAYCSQVAFLLCPYLSPICFVQLIILIKIAEDRIDVLFFSLPFLFLALSISATQNCMSSSIVHPHLYPSRKVNFILEKFDHYRCCVCTSGNNFFQNEHAKGIKQSIAVSAASLSSVENWKVFE